MNILVTGATGDVGGQVVRALRERGATVRRLVRPEGDLENRLSIDRALIGCDAACFITPHHAEEERLGHNFIDACEAAGVRRLVYISAFHPLSRSRVIQRLLDGAVGLIGPQYKAKLRIERRVRRSKLAPVALCPTNFYQNDELGMPEILGGTYPHPLGDRPANRVDTRDIGDAAARALLDDIPSGAYPVVGPDAWTGASSARMWADALGLPVRYDGDLEHWRATVAMRMPAAKAADFAKTYRVIQRFGIPVNARSIQRTTELLGRAPRSYRDYVMERVLAGRPSAISSAGR